MKGLRACGVALAGLASALAVPGAAVSADLGAPVFKAPPLAGFSWSGCYLGANGGWLGSRDDIDPAPAGNYLTAPGANAPPNLQSTGDYAIDRAALSHSYTTSGSGYEAGVQVGCNKQIDHLVFGTEADWQWSGLNSTIDASYPAFANLGNPAFTNAAHTESLSSKLNWFSTVRGRVGYAFDHLLVYATGGLAIAQFESDTTVSFGTFPVAPVYDGALHVGSDKTTQLGLALGGGLEYAFAPNWSLKAEYLYLSFAGFNYNSPLVSAAVPFSPGYAWNTSVTPHEQIVRAGINYKFDWATPFVSRN